MGVLGYVNRFPEIRDLPELEQWGLLKAAHRRLFASWPTLLAAFGGSLLLVSVCVGVGLGTASILGWSVWAGGLASALVMLAAMFSYNRLYVHCLHRTVRVILDEQSA